MTLRTTGRRLVRAFILARCWWWGLREVRSGLGLTWGSPWSARSRRYDGGRDVAHRVTFRLYDDR